MNLRPRQVLLRFVMVAVHCCDGIDGLVGEVDRVAVVGRGVKDLNEPRHPRWIAATEPEHARDIEPFTASPVSPHPGQGTRQTTHLDGKSPRQSQR